MNSKTLYINLEAPNRTSTLVAGSGSNVNTPLFSTNFIFADVYSMDLVFLYANGITASLSGNNVQVGLGIPGQDALCLSTLGEGSGNHWTGSLSLATFELSQSLGSLKSKNYALEVQVSGSSSINSYQTPCLVYNQVVFNPLSHLTGSLFMIFADSASYALSSSYSQQANSAISSSNATTASYALSSSRSQQSSTSSYVALPNGGFVANQEIQITDGSSILDEIPTRVQLTNNFGDAHSNITPEGLYVDTTGGNSMRLWAETSSYIAIRTQDKFGVGTSLPGAKLHVQGNISASSVTASLQGTASWSTNSITASIATSASWSPFVATVSASWASQSLSSSWSVSSSYALTSSFASTSSFSQSGSYTLSSSYGLNADSSVTCSGIVNANQFSFTSGIINSYSTSITCSSADDGRIINLITGSLVYLTGSLSSTFSTLIYQSGSGTVTITGSDSSVVVRQRQGYKNIGGQYGVVSIVRMPNGNFALSGDLS